MKTEEETEEDKNIFSPAYNYFKYYRSLVAQDAGEEDIVTDLDEQNQGLLPFPKTLVESEEYMLQVYELEKEESISKANEVLVKFPHCIEAQLCLAGWSEDTESRIDVLDSIMEEYKDRADSPEYLRAKVELSTEMMRGKYYEDSVELLEELLEEDIYNLFDVAYPYTSQMMLSKQWNTLFLYFEKLDDQSSHYDIYLHLVKLITYFQKFGGRVKTRSVLESAAGFDPLPFEILTGLKSISDIHEDKEGEVLMLLNILYSTMDGNQKFGDWIMRASASILKTQL